MTQGRLSELQTRVLARLAGMEPAWTLTGGGAIVGFHAPYRPTRDLDLFWRERRSLEESGSEVERRLRDHGLSVGTVQRTPSLHRCEVGDGTQTCLVDLVADPGGALNPPLERRVEGSVGFRVDSLQELAVNKLVALLSRYELRDLADLRELLERGADLELALRQAPEKDGGFSPATLAWVLESHPFEKYRQDQVLPAEVVEGLPAFRTGLIERLVRRSDPGDRVHERP